MDIARAAQLLVGASDYLVLLALFTAALALYSAPGLLAKERWRSLSALALALGVAMLFTWGRGAALRLSPGPSGVVDAWPTFLLIAINTLGLVCALCSPLGRRVLAAMGRPSLYTLGTWRIVFGVILLALGFIQALPPAFFWSAAIGDIAIGVWAIALAVRGNVSSPRGWLMWNAGGLLDLVQVLVLARLHVGPFFAVRPHLTPLNLVPLALVPLFIAMHVACLAAHWRERSSNASMWSNSKSR